MDMEQQGKNAHQRPVALRVFSYKPSAFCTLAFDDILQRFTCGMADVKDLIMGRPLRLLIPCNKVFSDALRIIAVDQRFSKTHGHGGVVTPRSDKKEWLVLDYGGNGKRHNRWDFSHDWGNLWNKIPKKREGVAPIKECPKCKYIVQTTVMVCPNCGHEFVKQAAATVDAVKIQMLEKLSNLRGRRLSDLTPTELADWAKISTNRKHAIRAAMAMEQRHPLYLKHFAQAMGYKQGWYDYKMFDFPKERIEFYDKIIR